ncbi:MAG: hypothetical protein JNL44_10560 [Gemmatimonadetes bacterium]|nr:hypothetical protein [Gemmatimonadota bacterium]
MGKSDNPRIDALDALLAEKRKHEGYLAKLEDRRAGTPEHVFARLRDEYLTKLTDLQVRASAEAEALTETLREDETAVQEIEQRLAAVTEERVEGELRAEVGEYDPKEWAKKLEALTASVSKIEKERDARVASFERTRDLLIEAKGADAVAALMAPARGAAAAPTAAPSAAPAAPAAPAPAPAAPASPAVAASAPVARLTPAAPHAAPTPRMTPAAAAAAQAGRAGAAPQSAPAPKAPPAAAGQTPPRGSPAAPAGSGAPIAGGPSFDELAFLNSVVGRTSTPLKSDQLPPPPRPSRPVGEIKEGPSGPARSAAAPQVPASPAPPPAKAEPEDDEPKSALGKPTPRSSQAIKTLKCQECGTLNYPTEWYCERCGGELAAL